MAKAFLQHSKALWGAWKRLGHKIGDFQARVVLTILYSVVILPFGVAARLFSDPLKIKSRPAKWSDQAQETYDMSWAQKQ